MGFVRFVSLILMQECWNLGSSETMFWIQSLHSDLMHILIYPASRCSKTVLQLLLACSSLASQRDLDRNDLPLMLFSTCCYLSSCCLTIMNECMCTFSYVCMYVYTCTHIHNHLYTYSCLHSKVRLCICVEMNKFLCYLRWRVDASLYSDICLQSNTHGHQNAGMLSASCPMKFWIYFRKPPSLSPFKHTTLYTHTILQLLCTPPSARSRPRPQAPPNSYHAHYPPNLHSPPYNPTCWHHHCAHNTIHSTLGMCTSPMQTCPYIYPPTTIHSHTLHIFLVCIQTRICSQPALLKRIHTVLHAHIHTHLALLQCAYNGHCTCAQLLVAIILLSFHHGPVFQFHWPL